MELNNSSGLGTDHMVMMLSTIELIYRWTIVKIMPFNKTRHLKLGEYSVDRSNAHILASITQQLINIFSSHMAIRAVFQYL